MIFKTIGFLVVLFLLLFGEMGGRTFPEPDNAALPKWRREIIDTTTGADYLREKEREVIIEINMLRTDPVMYSRMYLVPLREFYHDMLLTYPGEIPIATSEGVAALDECIREVEKARPVTLLSPRKGLMLAARDHAEDQGRTGETGHTGRDGSSPVIRMNRYGVWSRSAGENIDYGFSDARKIIIALLIDDGVPSRGHRTNLLSNRFTVVGVALGPHQVYRDMCVMDFAGGYVSK